jgi:hypothetical protein
MKDKRTVELIELVKIYKYKLEFSIVSFIFFLSMTLFCFFSSVIPYYFSILFGIVSIVFIQQIIRSYNYKRFYEIYYNAHHMIDEMFEE